jgi:arylsulfatase A-like enzyme
MPYEWRHELWCARKAFEFIDEVPEGNFCMQVAFQKPHHPLLPIQKFWDLYPDDLDLPESFDQSAASRPPHFKAQWEQAKKHTWDYARPGETYEDGARRAWRGTLACLSQLDDVVGKIVAGLKARDLFENTIVVYGSDHGCYHTIHGLLEKAPGICSDAVCRVPMIWRMPDMRARGQLSDALVENVDIPSTLTTLCDLPAMDSTDGRDLSPILNGTANSIRKVAVTENVWSKSIRWGNWRMAYYPDEMFGQEPAGELYEIARDPNETENLYFDDSHKETVEEGRRMLLDWLIQTNRVRTNMPAVKEGSGSFMGPQVYPTCQDGTAPNYAQPRNRSGNQINYL